MKKLFGCFCFALLMSLFGLSGKSVFASAQTPPLIENSLSLSAESSAAFQVAGIYWLPDYLKDNMSRDYNTNGDNEDPGDGGFIPSDPNPGDPFDPIDPDPDDPKSCSIYGFKAPDSVDTSLYSCTKVYPITGLLCYKDCVCNSDFKYTADNCLASEGKKLSGRSCDGKYENCICKPTVTVSTGEKCDLYCENACVEKSCKPSVSLGTGEECSEHCASSSGTCTAKKCKASVSYDTSKGEYCAEKCASNNSVCTKKGCNKICKDKFTGSAPTNGYITTESCSDCSGSYTIKTGWACNKGYHKSGSSCIADCTRSCYDTYTGSLPANASFTTKSCSDCSGSYTIKTGWTCKSGYTKSGNSCVKQCQVGDIFYSDATCSSSKLSGKTAIGVVASLSGRRYVISLKETSQAWGGQGSSVPNMNNASSAPTTDLNGRSYTQTLVNHSIPHPAAEYCNTYQPVVLGGGSNWWYLPAGGELMTVLANFNKINATLKTLNATQLSYGNYWSSNPGYSDNHAWAFTQYGGQAFGRANYSNIRCIATF